jgi:SNF2 family DNA or RNA helicase
MGEIQSQIYSALGRAYAGQLNMNIADTRYFRQRGRAVLTLLGAATNPGLLMKHVSEDAYLGLTWPPKEITANPFLTDVVNSYSQHEIPPKYEWLANMVRSRANNGQKVLVWSNFVGNLQAMEKLLAPFNPVLIYGGTTGEERIELLRRYRLDSSCSVLLSNPQTLGEGISLHEECHEAVYVDRSYNAGHYLQSLDRIHRLGLSADQQTNVHFLVSERSIDERVQSRLAVKIDRLAGIMNDHGLVAGTMPNENEDAELNYLGLETEDLADLFQHLKKLSR